MIVPSLGGFTMYITALCTCDGETESVEVLQICLKIYNKQARFRYKPKVG